MSKINDDDYDNINSNNNKDNNNNNTGLAQVKKQTTGKCLNLELDG